MCQRRKKENGKNESQSARKPSKGRGKKGGAKERHSTGTMPGSERERVSERKEERETETDTEIGNG